MSEVTTLSECPGFLWTGRSLTTCDHCQHRAWEHDRYLKPAGHTSPWPPGLVGYWLGQKLITIDRAATLRAEQPARQGPATSGATR